MERAVYSRRYDLTTVEGGLVPCVEVWFAHWTRPSLLVHSISVSNDGGAVATVRLSQSGGTSSPDLSLRLAVNDSSTLAVTGSAHQSPYNITVQVAVASNRLVTELRVPPGETARALALTAVVSSLNSSQPLQDAMAALKDGLEAGIDSLQTSHVSAWRRRWQEGRVEVPGTSPDARRLALSVNASLYAIMSASRPDFPYGLSPGGLASDAYDGHTFWDMDTWMFPVLNMLHPQLGRACLQYRWNRRAGAEAKARHNGYSGLMFPWESAFTGNEVQLGHWGRYEQHISSDVSLAAQQHWWHTRDAEWLREVGAPLARGIAQFWASRVVQNRQTGLYEILGIMPPDE